MCDHLHIVYPAMSTFPGEALDPLTGGENEVSLHFTSLRIIFIIYPFIHF